MGVAAMPAIGLSGFELDSHFGPPSTMIPNFSGSWLLVRVEGDWDAFVTEAGLGFLDRSKAKVAGVKLIREHLRQTEETFHVKTTTPISSTENSFRMPIPGQNPTAEQLGFDPDGVPIFVSLS